MPFPSPMRKVKVKSLSRVRPLATPWTAAYQAPPSTGFSRQEYWSGVPLPSPYNNNSYHNYVCKDKTHAAWTFHTVSNCPQISLLSPPLHHHYQAAMFLLLLNLEEEKPQSLGHLAGIPDSIPPQDAMASREARCQRKSHPSQGCKPLRRVQSQQGSESCPSLNVTST